MRRGFSLIEVIVSLVILAFGIMTLQSAVVRMVHVSTDDARTSTALQLVQDRLDLVRADPRYDSLTARYAATESNAGGFAGLTRSTAVAHVRDSTAAGITDYTRVTVSVAGKGLPRTIARTITVGAP